MDRTLNRKPVLSFLTLILFLNSFAQDLELLPKEFKDRAYEHVGKLSGFGIRNAGSLGEAKTIAYINDYFTSLSMETKVDTFSFQSYRKL